MARIVVITDIDVVGSGYKYVMTPLLDGLSKLGHGIKVAGLNYTGLEHDHGFSIIPAKDIQDCVAITNNLLYLWQPDVILVGMDIPIQIQIFEMLKGFQKPYVAITPMENGPLTMSWAMGMMGMSYVFFISELGKQEAMKAGLSKVDHMVVGVDTESWKPPTPDERKQIRAGLGISDDEFVVLSVADNQERKNLAAALEIIAGLKSEVGERKVRLLLVTREHNPFGLKLRDYAVRLDINKEVNIYERGMPRDRLWGLYAAADVFLNTSKAEGLGLPVLDAMASGIPVVATDTGALHELLEDNRGYLISPEFSFTDVFGNSKRDMVSTSHAVSCMKMIADGINDNSKLLTSKALEYVRNLKWEVPVQQVHAVIERITNEQKA